MKEPASPHLRSEPAILAGMARASCPRRGRRGQDYVDDYDRIRDTMAKALPGFEGFNERVRQQLGFRIPQPARELEFLTPSGRAEFSHAPLPDVVPPEGRLVLGTMRSHDQWNTTIYSNDDRYRGVKNLRTLVFMNRLDMQARGLEEMTSSTSRASDGRLAPVGVRLPRARLRHPAGQRGRLHAGAERALPDRRLQHAVRPAADEAPPRRDRPGRSTRRRSRARPRAERGCSRRRRVRARGRGGAGTASCARAPSTAGRRRRRP